MGGCESAFKLKFQSNLKKPTPITKLVEPIQMQMSSQTESNNVKSNEASKHEEDITLSHMSLSFVEYTNDKDYTTIANESSNNVKNIQTLPHK